jgi:hypothetical protein
LFERPAQEHMRVFADFFQRIPAALLITLAPSRVLSRRAPRRV